MKNMVTFSGAGLSRESGIPTFRDSNGLWHQHRVEDVASPEGWRRDPKLVLEFYAARFKNIRACQPNPAHFALARFHDKFDVVHITQNIDDLLERAGCTNIWHLHGSILRRKCERHWSTNVLEDSDGGCDYAVMHDHAIEWGDLCPKCSSQVRPDVVWFGEGVDMRHQELASLIDRADVFICVGTSAQVSPAADLLWMFRPAPKKVFIDPNPPAGLSGYEIIAGPAGEHLPRVVDDLLKNVSA